MQASLYGLAGVVAGPAEGVEVSLLGLVFGAHVWPPAIKLPIIGRVGWSRGGAENPLLTGGGPPPPARRLP